MGNAESAESAAPPEAEEALPAAGHAPSPSPEAGAPPPAKREERHRRAATWTGSAPARRRPYQRAPWVGQHRGTPAQSDSESDAGSVTPDVPGLSRNNSVPSGMSSGISPGNARMKRTFSEASDCSELGTPEEQMAAIGLGSSASGTWPRLPKRSSRTNMRDIDVWELTRALAREKSDLADQLASQLTADNVRAAGARASGGSGSPTGSCASASSSSQPQPSSGGLDVYRSAASWEGEVSAHDPRMQDLDKLVKEEDQQQQQAGGVDDGTVDAILGALQSQFKPDDKKASGSSSQPPNAPPPPHSAHPPPMAPHPHAQPPYPPPGYAYPQHHLPPPHHGRGGPYHYYPRPQHEPPPGYSYPPPGYSYAAPPRPHGYDGGHGYPPPSRSHEGAGPSHLPPPPPPLPGVAPAGGGGLARTGSDMALVRDTSMSDDDSPLVLSADQLAMYEGLFDDVDFANIVGGSRISPKLTASLASAHGVSMSPGGFPLSPVLEAMPGASPAGSEAFTDTFRDVQGHGGSHLLPSGLPPSIVQPPPLVAGPAPPPPNVPPGPDEHSAANVPQGAMPPGLVPGAQPPALEREGSGSNRKEWALAEDELILECVKTLGCKWRQIASMLPGRSDDAVRNRWNRLKDPNAPGLLGRDYTPGTGTAYRCSKCGQLKKNHRCTWVPPPEPEEPPAAAPANEGAGSSDDAFAEGSSPAAMAEALANALAASTSPEGSGPAGGAAWSAFRADEERKTQRVGWKAEEDELITRSVAELGHKWFQIAERLPGRTDHAIRNRWHRLLTMRQDSMQQMQHGPAAAAAVAAGALVTEHVADGAAAVGETLDDPLDALA